MSKVLRRIAKKYASRYLQLKVRHRVVETYLAKIKLLKILSVDSIVWKNSQLNSYIQNIKIMTKTS